MKVKIITQEMAVRLGLMTKAPHRVGSGGDREVNVIGYNPKTKKIGEAYTIDLDTGEKRTEYHDPDYWELKEKLKIK